MQRKKQTLEQFSAQKNNWNEKDRKARQRRVYSGEMNYLFSLMAHEALIDIK